MNESTPTDHGEIVANSKPRLSLAWIFPLLAIIAAGWLFGSNWAARGPEIEVTFDEAPGMQAGKTPLVYRGVPSGIVTGLRLDSSLKKVVLTVRLKAFAAELAREGTVFWIDQPIVGIGDTSGLDALISGNSLQAQMGTGQPAREFAGASHAPLTPLESPSLILKLRAPNIPLLDRGTPIFYRGLNIGFVEHKLLDESGKPYLRVVIEPRYAKTIHSHSRFWSVPGTSIRMGQSGVKLEMLGVKSILLGGIEVDDFGQPGPPIQTGEEFTLFANRQSAEATGQAVLIQFTNSAGLVAGESEIRYRGLPIGVVESVKLAETGNAVMVGARFHPEFDHLHPAGTRFNLVTPEISLNGISGLETLVSGVYIECLPGPGSAPATQFIGHTPADASLTEALAENDGLRVILEADSLPPIPVGAPVRYRGLPAGRVVTVQSGSNGKSALALVIRRDFASFVTQNARFWPLPAAQLEAGSGVFKMQLAGLEALIDGGITFDVFSQPGAPAESGAVFALSANEAAARAVSPPVRITFDNGQGLRAGVTQVRYRGLPVGIVESVQPKADGVETIVRFEDGYDFLRRSGSIFSIVRLSISLNGVTGMETALSGVYIECVPATGGPLRDRFTGSSEAKAEFAQEEESGFEVNVTTARTSIAVDAPVFYRGLVVGKVGRKSLADDGKNLKLSLVIQRPYAALLRTNTQFWDASGAKVSLGWLSLKVQTPSLDAIANGAIAFATPNNAQMGPAVKPGHVFPLNANPRKEWLNWSPDLPTR